MKTLVILIVFLIASIGVMIYTKSESFPAPILQDRGTHSESSRSVNISNKGLSTFPTDILSRRYIQQLNISNNNLPGALPAEIRFLQDLRILDISNNDMTGLPAELGQLSQLRLLNAAHNKLTGIPHELGNLQNLEILDLSGNEISQQDLEIIRSRLPKTTRIIL